MRIRTHLLIPRMFKRAAIHQTCKITHKSRPRRRNSAKRAICAAGNKPARLNWFIYHEPEIEFRELMESIVTRKYNALEAVTPAAKLLLMKTCSKKSFARGRGKLLVAQRRLLAKLGGWMKKKRDATRRETRGKRTGVERGLWWVGIGRIILRRRACLLVEKFWSSRSVGSLRPQLHLQVIRLTSTKLGQANFDWRNPVTSLSVFASSSRRSFSSLFRPPSTRFQRIAFSIMAEIRTPNWRLTKVFEHLP